VACQIYDWDGDGKNEVVLSGDGFVFELDGATGHEKRRLPLPKDAGDCLVFVNLAGNSRPTDVLVKTRYTQIWAYDRNWKQLWTVENPGGYRTAHQPVAVDLDGDGRAKAYVFQDACLLPWRRVLDNVALPLELSGVPKAKRHAIARQLIATVGLGEAVERFPDELSGGMKMRVSLARALITQPRLLLLDEPFAALDEFTRQYLDDHLQALFLEHGMTVVFVTHSIAEAVFLADRVIMLTPRTGGIVLDHWIDLPRPRDRGTRVSAAYLAHIQRLAEALTNGVVAA